MDCAVSFPWADLIVECVPSEWACQVHSHVRGDEDNRVPYNHRKDLRLTRLIAQGQN
jgi:hypothetical protein